MLKLMGKKIFTIYAQNCCLAKPMWLCNEAKPALSGPFSFRGTKTLWCFGPSGRFRADLNSIHLKNMFHLYINSAWWETFLSSAEFFQSYIFQKILSGIP